MPFLRMSASKSTDNRNFRLFVRWAQDHRLPDIWKESSLDRLLGGYVCTMRLHGASPLPQLTGHAKQSMTRMRLITLDTLARGPADLHSA